MGPSTSSDFSTLLLDLYRVAHEESIGTFQDEALRVVKRVLPFDSSMWGTATATQGGIDIHTIHLHEKSPEMIAAYEPIKDQDTAAATVFGKRHITRRFNAEDWWSAPHQREYRDFLRRFEHENLFITADSNPRTNFVHWVSLFRAGKEAHCSEEERRLLSDLAPHLMQSLAMNRTMHLERLDAGDKALAPLASAISDLRGVVYHADPQFVALAAVEWDALAAHQLPAPLLSHMLSSSKRFIGRHIVVWWYVQQSLLFVKARPRCAVDGLGEKEYLIATLVGRGLTYKEIAKVTERSPATVRNQIQQVYSKLEVSTIAGLIAALRSASMN